MNRLFFLLLLGMSQLTHSLFAQTPTCCNILSNGDFEQGYAGFSSSLPQNCGCAATSYCVGTNFQVKCSGWHNVPDHTSGSGNFLIIDGDDSSPAPVDVWRVNTTIISGVQYCFSFWAASQYDTPFDLGLAVNGELVPGAVFNVAQGTPFWTQYTFSWTATSAGSNISIQQLLQGSFEDFGIDDIEFGQQLEAKFVASPNIACGMNVQFLSQSTGPNPYQYSWNFGDPGNPGNTSALQNPVHNYAACGDYEVCLTITKGSCIDTYCETITVTDDEPPVITCPAGVSVNAIPSSCTMMVNGIKWLNATDNCKPPQVNYTVTGATQSSGANNASGTVFNQGTSVVTYTATDVCGNTKSCSFQVVVTCAAENCACPGGGAPGANLVANGNFSSGPSGFGSGLTLNPFCGQGNYNVDKNFRLFCPSWDSLPDHTNDAQKKYLILDGADNGSTPTDLWTSSVVLSAGANYCFSFWWASAYPNGDFDFDIEAYIRVGATDYVLGTTKVLQNTLVWTQANYSWNSGPLSGPQTIRIRQVSGDDHRDFGIDDICFRLEAPPCDAEFTFQNIDDCGKIQFSSTSVGPTGFQLCWDFDNDPSTCESTSANPVWQFPGCGTYNVCLTLTGNGCSKTICHTVTVTDLTPPVAKCQPGIGVTLNANCEYTVTPSFVNAGSTDNCGIKSLDVTPNLLSGCGNTIVTLTVTDWCNNSSSCTMGIQTIETVPPTLTCPSNVSANAVPTSCSIIVNGIGLVSVSDNCGTITSVSYTVNGANSGINNASGTTFNQGNSIVQYTATDQCGNTGTCSFMVNVTCQAENCSCPGNCAPSPNLIANGDFSGGSVGFTSGLSGPSNSCGSGSYGITTNFSLFCSGWQNLGAASPPNFLIIDGSTASGPTVLWKSPVNLLSGKDYCFSFNWALGFAHPFQNFPISIDIVDASGTVIQSGLGHIGNQTIAVNLNWTPANFPWNSGTLPSGQLYVQISQLTGSLFRDFGLDDICFTQVVPAATVSITGNTSICPGESTSLTATGGFSSYQWSSPPGGTQATISVSPTTTTTYTVTATDSHGCTSTASVTVQVKPLPNANAGADQSVCTGQTATLTATGGGTYQWSPNGSTANPYTTAPILTNTTFTVTVTAANGCTATDQVLVMAKPLPVANAGPDQTVCTWQTATLAATGGGNYQWSPGGSTANPYTTAPIQANSTFTVTVTAANGCTATDQVTVQTKDCSCQNNSGYFVQNSDFSNSTPCNQTDEDICQAVSWCSAWPDGPGISTGDLYNTTNCTPTQAFAVLGTPSPASQNTFAGLWCKPHTKVVWRESIMDQLQNGIWANSGSYKVEMKIACLVGVYGTARLSVYGVPQGASSTVPSPNALTGSFPVGSTPPLLNTNLFDNPPGVTQLGTYFLNASNCTSNFAQFSFIFNSNILANTAVPYDRIFITRDDGAGGITYVAIDDICIEPAFDTNSCDCGPLDFAYFWQQQVGWIRPIADNQSALTVPCPKTGANYAVFGSFRCAPDLCGSNTYDWKLDRPGALIDLTGTGTAGYPYFFQQINAADCSQPGNYQLSVTRHCGNKTCSKVFNFKIDNCPCPCDSLKKDVGYGFTISSVFFPPNQCRKRFKPVSLCVNDDVTWTVSGLGVVGNTQGNAPITISFPGGSGSYFVCMIVKRTDPNGTVCNWEFCRNVTVHCGIDPAEPVTRFCDNLKIKNSGFNQNVVRGFLDESGAVADWDMVPNPGDGRVFAEDTIGSLDDGHMILMGRKGNFAGIMQEVDLPSDNFTFIYFDANNYQGADMPAGTRIEVRLQNEPFPYPGLVKQVLLSQPVENVNGWYQLDSAVGISINTDLHYLVICLQNDDETRNSIVGLDNIEICSSSTSPTQEPGQESPYLRIFPNPNPGTFTVELSAFAEPDMSLRIIGLTGQQIREQNIASGNRHLTVQASDLPPGLYFLQAVSRGKVLAVEKFVKQ